MAIFPYFMYWKCPYVGVGVVQKRTKIPLRNIRMVPNNDADTIYSGILAAVTPIMRLELGI